MCTPRIYGKTPPAEVKKDVEKKYPMYTRCWSDVEMLYTAVDGEKPDAS